MSIVIIKYPSRSPTVRTRTGSPLCPASVLGLSLPAAAFSGAVPRPGRNGCQAHVNPVTVLKSTRQKSLIWACFCPNDFAEDTEPDRRVVTKAASLEKAGRVLTMARVTIQRDTVMRVIYETGHFQH